MDFRPLAEQERTAILNALRNNAEHERPMFMNRATSFVDKLDEVTDEEVVFAIKSIPSHY